jgi:glutathione S-transferase
MFIPSKTDRSPAIARPEQYVVYGWQRSYFTHKLLAALHFYQAPYRFEAKTSHNADEIRFRSGTHQVPVLHTPENWMIADTTPILYMLDARFPARRMFPKGALGIVTQVVEEYFDEWIARTTVHWRWNYPENHRLLALDAAQGDNEAAAALIVWGGKVCRATGVSSAVQQRAAEAEYIRMLEAARQQLTQTAYLLGDRPSAVDCIVLAGLRAHFLYDPAPNRALRNRFADIVLWTEQNADSWEGTGNWADLPQPTSFVHFVLSEMKDTYARFALGNRDALHNGAKAFVASIYGEDVSYLARPYIEQSRRMIVQRIADELTEEQQRHLRTWLDGYGLNEVFSA